MTLLFIINLGLVLMGIIYIARLIYFRLNYEQLVKKYKPGTIAYETFQRDSKPILLPISIAVTVVVSISMVILANKIIATYGDQGVAMVQGGAIAAALTTVFCSVVAYRLFKNR